MDEYLVRPCVISISGTSGAGKSTLAQRTASLLPAAVVLGFDDYVQLTNYAPDIRQWLSNGANPDEIRTPQLVELLRAARVGGTMEWPRCGRLDTLPEYVLLDEPFGKARSEIAPFVDFAVHIDLPPDVAMARRIIRSIQNRKPGNEDKLLEFLVHDLKTYLLATREAYAAMDAAARRHADLVLDGTEDSDTLARQIIAQLPSRGECLPQRGEE